MRKKEDRKVLLIAETNWLESIALVQDMRLNLLHDILRVLHMIILDIEASTVIISHKPFTCNNMIVVLQRA